MPKRRFVKALAFTHVLLIAMLCQMTAVVYAAGSSKQSADDEQRITRLETEYEDMRATVIKLDRIHEKDSLSTVLTEGRLSKLETSLDSIKTLLSTLVGGMCLMLMEAGFRLIKQRNAKG